jgi:hypothetical protein
MFTAMSRTNAAEVPDNGVQNRLIGFTKKYSSLNVRILVRGGSWESYVFSPEKDVKKFLKYSKSASLKIPENADENEYIRQVLPLVKTFLQQDLAT